MNCRWSIAPAQAPLVTQLAAGLKISPFLSRCLVNRGFNDLGQTDRFLEPRLKQLRDPFLVPNMEQAVLRLFQAHAAGERLVIFGDYDVDGVTSTALLVEVLGKLGWNVSYYLPHRLEEGYGLSPDAVRNCLNRFPSTLLLAVDCGSTAGSTIEALNREGIDTIVLDHHQVSLPVPPAAALVNPHLPGQADDTFRELCSVGLAFKLAHALVKHGRLNGFRAAAEFDLRPLLDLVALGTVADLVPLRSENRILVSAGLERLHTTERPGLRALKQVAAVNGRPGVYEVGFRLAPRLNAAGRLENALLALQLVLSQNCGEAENLARALDVHNRERQEIETSIAEEVIRTVRARFEPARDYVIVEGQPQWHVGVVGIVASRVLREFYRPTVIVGGDGDEWRGSGRSIEGFDLAEALRSCSDLLARHGGHAMAAGLSLPGANLDAFRTRLNELARARLSLESLQPELRIDFETSLGDLTLDALAELARLEPFGQGNPPVQLVACGLRHHRPPQRMGKDERHVKMWVTDGGSVQQAVWWNCAEKALPDGAFDLAFVPQINDFNDRRCVQLRVLDWRAPA